MPLPLGVVGWGRQWSNAHGVKFVENLPSWKQLGQVWSLSFSGELWFGPVDEQSAVILGAAKCCLSSRNVEPKYSSRGWHLPAIHDWAPGRNAMAICFFFRQREMGLLPPLEYTTPGAWTPWGNCRMLSSGRNIHPLSARFSCVQMYERFTR